MVDTANSNADFADNVMTDTIWLLERVNYLEEKIT